MTAATVIDARRLLCPLPVIRTQDGARAMRGGELLEVRFTDPGALYDIPAWCRINGHRVVATDDSGDTLSITIEIGVRE